MKPLLIAFSITVATSALNSAGDAQAATMNYIGTWSARTAYSVGAVVVYGNQTYYANTASTNKIPSATSTYWKLVGTNGMDYKGVWSPTTTYQVGSVVNYNGQNFYSLQATNLNKIPETQTTWWVLVGTNGNTVKSGAGAPLSTQGVIGDFWIDTTSKVLFGPKTVSGWSLPGTSMIGPVGATGVRGPQGSNGNTGATGAQGPQGQIGATGATGAQGVAGLGYGATTSSNSFLIANSVLRVFAVTSLGAYSIGDRVRVKSSITPANYMEGVITAISGTNVSVQIDAISGSGTFASWVFSLAGNVGTQGPKGDTGATGARGAQGSTGNTGATGAQGPQGPAGPTGATGMTGPRGQTGTTGAQGDRGPPGGNTILSGSTSPTAGIGTSGDFYLDRTARILYGPKIASGWPQSGIPLVGTELPGAALVDADGKVIGRFVPDRSVLMRLGSDLVQLSVARDGFERSSDLTVSDFYALQTYYYQSNNCSGAGFPSRGPDLINSGYALFSSQQDYSVTPTIVYIANGRSLIANSVSQGGQCYNASDDFGFGPFPSEVFVGDFKSYDTTILNLRSPFRVE
jgi:hypothetical protein